MEIMGKEFYFTFGPIFTVIIAPIATPSAIVSFLESLPLRFWNRILGRAQLQKSQFGKM